MASKKRQLASDSYLRSAHLLAHFSYASRISAAVAHSLYRAARASFARAHGVAAHRQSASGVGSGSAITSS
jgi:hypothetical protein